MSFVVPIPATNIHILWAGMGAAFGRAFGKKLDYDIQQSDWFKGQHYVFQWIIKHILDFTHHWWIGALLWLYAPLIAARISWITLAEEIMWFGIGLLIDDLRDVPNLKRRYIPNGVNDDE